MKNKAKITYINLDTVDSTNLYLRRKIETNVSEYTVVSSDTQTAGKGRQGHHWESPKGSSVSSSMIIYPKDIPEEKLSCITLITGLCVSRVIEKVCGLKTMIKWPNDILVNEKKISGILVENIPDEKKNNALIIGIGINVHMKSFLSTISDIATSIEIEMEKEKEAVGLIKRSDIINCIWEEFVDLYEKFIALGFTKDMIDEYRKKLISMNRVVCIIDSFGKKQGVCKGIDDRGRLLVEINKKIETIDFGEVSVRGIYGYV